MTDLRVKPIQNSSVAPVSEWWEPDALCDPTQQCCPSESTIFNIAPPLSRDAISPAPQSFLTPSQYMDLRKRNVEHKILEVWFLPKDGLTREAVMQAFGITNPDLVHEVNVAQEQKFLVEFPSERYMWLSYPTLPEPVSPSNELEAAKQKLALELAGLEGLRLLENGYLSIRFTTDKTTQQIKDYIIYWISNTPQGMSVGVLGYKIGNRQGFASELADAQKVSRALQELLKLRGYLPEGRSAAGGLDDQVIMNSYSYLQNNPRLFQPRKQELEDRLNDQWARTLRLLQQYIAIRDSQQISAEFKPQILSEFAMRILDGFATIRKLAKEGIEVFAGEEEVEFRRECQKKVDFVESVMRDVLGWIIGNDEGGLGYLQTVELTAAENNLLKYFEVVREWEKLIREHAHPEKQEEKAAEAGSLAREAISAYRQIFNALHEYEKNFAWLPGVKERCQKLRQEILAKLSADDFIARFEKKNRREDTPDFTASSVIRTMANELIDKIKQDLNDLEQTYQSEPEYLAEQAQALYEVAADLSPSDSNSEMGKDDPEKIKKLYGKAAYISEQILKEDDFRTLMISFFNMVLKGEDKISIRKVFEKYHELLDKLSSDQLEKVGKYLVARQYYSAQGLSDEEIEKKTKPLYNAAKSALEKIEKLCKIPDNLLESANLKSALQTLIREAYRQMTTYNAWAVAHGKKLMTFSDFARLGQQIVASLPESQKEAKRIFEILSKVSENPNIAREELKTELQRELKTVVGRGLFASQALFHRFDKEAQGIDLDLRFFSQLSIDAGKHFRVHRSDDLRTFFPNQFNEPNGYYILGERVDDTGASRLYFESVPDSVVNSASVTRESRYGGTVYTRDPVEALEENGAWAINIALHGKLPTTGALRQASQGVGTDALDHEGLRSAITAFQMGDYWIEGGVKFKNAGASAALDAVLSYQENGLTKEEIALTRRILRHEEMFKEEEVPAIRALVNKLQNLNVDFLSDTGRILYGYAVSDIKSAIENHLKHKGGLNAQEVAILSRLNHYLEEYGIMITDGGFIKEEPSQEMIDKVPFGVTLDDGTVDSQEDFISTYRHSIPILQKIHYQLQKLATMYAPDERIDGTLLGFYVGFWKTVWKAMGETIKPPSIQNTQVAGLPPIQILQVKAYLYPERIEEVTQAIRLLSVLEKAKEEGQTILNDLKPEEIMRLRILLRGSSTTEITDQQLKNILESIKLIYRRTEEFQKLAERMKELNSQLRQKEIDPLTKEIEELESRLKSMNNQWEDPDRLISANDADSMQSSSKTLSRRLNLLQQRMAKLRDLEFQLNRILEFKEYLRDPIVFLTYLDRLNEILVSLKTSARYGIFNLGDSDSQRTLSDAIKKVVEQTSTAISVIYNARPDLLKWLNVKQALEIKKQEHLDFLTSDKFTRVDWEKFKSRFGSTLENPDWQFAVVSAFSKILVQRDNHIYGPFGRDTNLTPMQALENFFESGGELSLSMTIPEIGEPLEKTYAKLSLTKAFENLPQAGEFNALMPTLMMIFGGNGGMGGFFNLTRDSAAFLGRGTDMDLHSYGSESMAEKEKIVNNALLTLQNNFLTGLALTSNQVSPRLRIASQLHYLMIYSPYGSQYLDRKLGEAQRRGVDLGVIFSEINEKDIEDFVKYIRERVIPDLQRNPRLARQVRYLIEKHYVVSDLFKAVISDALESFDHGRPVKKNYQSYLETLNPSGNQNEQPIVLHDSLNETFAHPLAQVLEDMLKIAGELNKANVIEDFKKQSLNSLDVAGRMIETRIPHIDPENNSELVSELREHIKILQVDSSAKPGQVETASALEEAYHDWVRWKGIYFPRIEQDFATAFSSKEEFREFARRTGREMLEGLVNVANYGWQMPRNIGMGLSDIWGGIADYLEAKTEDDKLKALNKIKDGLAHTGAAFALFETIPAMFYLSIKDALEQGHYGAVISEAFLISVMFGAGPKLMQGLEYFGKNALIGLDKIIRKHLKLARFGMEVPYSQKLAKYIEATNAKLGNNKFAYRNGKLLVRGQMTLAQKFELMEIFRGQPEALARVELLYQKSRCPFIPVEQNAYVANASRGLGVRILKWGTVVYPVTQHAYREAASWYYGNGSHHLNVLRNRTGKLHLRIGSGVEMYEGEQTNARTNHWITTRAYRHLRYFATVKSYGPGISQVWSGIKHGISSAVESPFKNIFGFLRGVSSVEGQILEALKKAAANPDGYTPLEVYRASDGYLEEISKLEAEIKDLTNEIQEKVSQGQNIDEEGAKLEKVQNKLEALRRTNKGNMETIWVKNSRFIEIASSPNGITALWEYFADFDRGSTIELRRQFEQIHEIYEANKREIEQYLREMEGKPKMTNGVKIMEEIASPHAKGATKVYAFNLGGDRVIYLRGDQIGKIMEATLKGKSLDFVLEYGLTPQEALAIGQQIQSAFGAERFKELTRLTKAAAKWKVILPASLEISLADLSARDLIATVREGRIISSRSLVSISPNIKALLGGRSLPGYILIAHELSHPDIAPSEGKIRLSPQIFANWNDGEPRILYLDSEGKVTLLSVEERFAREGIRVNHLNGQFNELIEQKPAEFEKFIQGLKRSRVVELSLPQVSERGLGTLDLVKILGELGSSNVPRSVTIQNIASDGPSIRASEIPRSLPVPDAQPVTPDMIVEENPLTETTFDFQAKVKRLGIRVNGAFEGVNEEMQREFIEAVEEAQRARGAKILVIEEGVYFGNGGEETLRKLINRLKKGKVPKKVTIAVKDGTVYIKGGVRFNSSTVSMNGLGGIEKVPDVSLGINGVEFKAVARELGLPETASVEAIQEEVGKRFGERLGRWLGSNSGLAIEFRKSARYQELLKYTAQQAFAQAGKGTQRAVSAASFATGILSFFAVEEILDIIGVENKSARFALVLGGGHVVSQGANSLLSSAVTAEGRAYLSALVKNPPAALVNGLKNANWISGTSNLLTGVGYAILTSNLYNHILNAYGVSADSWLRGAFPQFVVGMGGGTALGTAAARTALGRAAIPLAVAHLASTVINLFDSDYEQSVQERAHEAMRLDLAKGGTLDHVLLMTDIVANLISGGAFGESALSQSDLNQVARADAQLLAELQPQLLNALRSRWMADLLHYDGSAQDLNFFTNPELSTEKLAEILKQEVRFENQRKIIGYRTESGNCSIWHGEYMCGPDRTIPIYDANSPEIREKSAYEDIVAGRLNLNRPDLKEVLRNEYNIQDPGAFLQKVEVANLQKLVRYLVSLEPDTIDPSTLNIADNRELRAIFDKAGHLRPGKEQRLIAWLGKDQPLKELITEFRKMTRLQALLKGAQPTEVDKQLGLVKSDGSINESSPTFATLRQAAEQAFLMTTSSQ